VAHVKVGNCYKFPQTYVNVQHQSCSIATTNDYHASLMTNVDGCPL